MGSLKGQLVHSPLPHTALPGVPEVRRGLGHHIPMQNTSVEGWSGSASELQLKPPPPNCLKTITAAAWAGGETWRNTMMLVLRKAKRQTLRMVITLPSCAHFSRHRHHCAVTPRVCSKPSVMQQETGMCKERETPLLC